MKSNSILLRILKVTPVFHNFWKLAPVFLICIPAKASVTILSCSVDIKTVESIYFPRFGFNGEQRWDNVLIQVIPSAPMPTIVIKGLAFLSGAYETERDTGDKITFHRKISDNNKYFGSIDRYSGRLFITEENWPSPAFSVAGYCQAAQKLF